MLLQYGPVNLNLIKLDDYKREAVYHGPNYLYTRHTLTVTATFNPGAQVDRLAGDAVPAFNAAGSLGLPFVPAAAVAVPPAGAPVGPLVATAAGAFGAGPAAVAALAVPGAYTAQAVKHQLMQPRQVLIFSVGGVVVLRSPFPGYPNDCTLGPKPLDCSVTQIAGTKTFRVRFSIQTDVNEAPLRRSSLDALHAVLSHRWAMEHRLDLDFFTTRVVSGRVVFRADSINHPSFGGVKPDDFRRYFFHPIPAGFQRKEVRVKALDDGVTVDYQIADVEVPVGWTQANVTRVEGVHSFVLKRAVWENAIYDQATSTLIKTAEILSRARTDLANAAGETAALAALGASAITNTLRAAFPVAEHHMEVEVWGNNNANRNALDSFARKILMARINSLAVFAGIGLLGGYELGRQHWITQKHVRCSMRLLSGPALTLGLIANATINGLFPPTDSTGTLLVAGGGGVVGAVLGAPNIPGPPDDGRSRGTYLETCIAGALTADLAVAPNQAQANPPAPSVRAAAGALPPTDF